jgi:hypothetical protein
MVDTNASVTSKRIGCRHKASRGIPKQPDGRLKELVCCYAQAVIVREVIATGEHEHASNRLGADAAFPSMASVSEQHDGWNCTTSAFQRPGLPSEMAAIGTTLGRNKGAKAWPEPTACSFIRSLCNKNSSSFVLFELFGFLPNNVNMNEVFPSPPY